MTKRTTKPTTKPKRYYIVNPSGAIHEVTYEHAKRRLKVIGFRMATPADIKAYHAAEGHQVAGRPLAKPWTPEPEPEPDPEE